MAPNPQSSLPRPTHHTTVPQVQGIPGEALGQGVGLLADVVFVRLHRPMGVHHFSWKKSTAVSLTLCLGVGGGELSSNIDPGKFLLSLGALHLEEHFVLGNCRPSLHLPLVPNGEPTHSKASEQSLRSKVVGFFGNSFTSPFGY